MDRYPQLIGIGAALNGKSRTLLERQQAAMKLAREAMDRAVDSYKPHACVNAYLRHMQDTEPSDDAR